MVDVNQDTIVTAQFSTSAGDVHILPPAGGNGDVHILPPTGTLEIINRSRYDIVDVSVNGSDYEAPLLGESRSLRFTPGTATYQLGIGFHRSTGLPEP